VCSSDLKDGGANMPPNGGDTRKPRREAPEVIKIDHNPAPLSYSRLTRQPPAPPNLSLEPSNVVASALAATSNAVCYDMHEGVVSLVRQRRTPRLAATLGDIAREARATCARAAALWAGKAKSEEEIHEAHHLVRRRYEWRGYDVPEAQPPCGMAQNRLVFIARDGDATVGTITLGLDGREGLTAEGTYPEAIGAARAEGRRVCEVTRFAISEEADSKAVLAALFSLAYATASVHGATDVYVEVNPRHVRFYQRVLGFFIAGNERMCQRVKAPSVLLTIRMHDLEQRLSKLNESVMAREMREETAIAA